MDPEHDGSGELSRSELRKIDADERVRDHVRRERSGGLVRVFVGTMMVMGAAAIFANVFMPEAPGSHRWALMAVTSLLYWSYLLVHV